MPDRGVGPSPDAAASQTASAQGTIATIDDALRRIENLVPGFGGLYVNNDDELVIRLRDSRFAPAAPQAILQVLGRLPGRPGKPIRIQPADYTFAELQGWMRKLLRTPGFFDGVIIADIDERDNRLYFGVPDDGVGDRIRIDLGHLGIPAAAVTIRAVAQPTKLFANDSLTSVSTPVVGGVMVQTRNWTVGGQFGANKPHCTLGFNAWLLPDTMQLYAITNDHCTQQMGSSTGDTLWQANWAGAGSRIIAVEVGSAPYRAIADTACPTGNLCRYSDAALFRYYNSSDGLLGDIARPLWYSQGSTPFTLVRDTAEFHINGDLPSSRLRGASPPALGEWLSKVGVTTGWSSGRVDRTCFWLSEAPGRRLVCQFEVKDVMGVGATFSKGGDSGSPTFRAVYSEDDVYGGTTWLAGIVHSGGGGVTDTASFLGSDINLLYLDLGQMKTYRGPLCVPDPNYWGCL